MWVITVDPLVAVVGFALLALSVAIWVDRLRRGVPFRPFSMFVGSVVCLAVFFLVEGGSWMAVGATAPLDLILLGLAIVVGAVYTDASTRIVRYHDGRPGYRTRAGIPVAWFLLFSLTVVAEVHFLGQVDLLGMVLVLGVPDPMVAFGYVSTVPDAVALGLVDAAFALSTGLLLGQTAGTGSRLVRHRWAMRHAPRSARTGS